jgi:hypothetical protein
MVEAMGTAPMSCLSVELYQQTVLYLYHTDTLLSIIKVEFLVLQGPCFHQMK